MKNANIKIQLTAAINSLDEVSVKNHPFTGNLQYDVSNYELKNYVNEFTLDLPNAGKAPKNEVERIGLRLNQYSGIIGSLYGWMSGENKRLKKIKKLAIEDYYLNEIRTFIKDSFFINELKIPKDKISLFLNFSKSKNIIGLYRENKKTELVDLLVSESETFLKKLIYEKK